MGVSSINGRSICNLSRRCDPFSRLTKEDALFEWNKHFQKALECIKEYLIKPLVLASPVKAKHLVLYISLLERSLGALVAQENAERKENALYYLGWRRCDISLLRRCLWHLYLPSKSYCITCNTTIAGGSQSWILWRTFSTDPLSWAIRKVDGSTPAVQHRIHPTKAINGTRRGWTSS